MVHINSGYEGSIKTIIDGIEKAGDNLNIKTYIGIPNSRNSLNNHKNKITVGNFISRIINRILHRKYGNQSYGSIFSTLIFILKINLLKPNLIHLHNLHGNYLNYKILLNYLILKKIPVVLTLHDCWYFTGGCAHFNNPNCNKWITDCNNCPQLGIYPLFNKDKTNKELKFKEKMLQKIENLVVVCPSEQIYKYAKKSKVFKNKKILTIHNFFDNSIFYFRGNFRNKLNIKPSSRIFLSVISRFNFFKGKDIILEFCDYINEEDIFIVVGAKRPKKLFYKKNIIFMPTIKDPNKLAEIYSAADVLINPSRRESFGLVNIEALACGTPIVSYNIGIIPELIKFNVARLVKSIDVKDFYNNGVRAMNEITRERCFNVSKNYNMNLNSQKYISIYKKLVNINIQKKNRKL